MRGKLFFTGFSVLLFFMLFTPILTEAQEIPQSPSSGIDVSVTADAWFPKIFDPETGISNAFGTTVQGEFLPIGPFSLLARIGIYSLRTGTNTSLLYTGGAGGFAYSRPLSERFTLGAFGFVGLGKIPDVKIPQLEEQSYGLYELGLRLGLSFRLSPAIKVSLFTGYERLATPDAGFLDAPAVGIGVRIDPGEVLGNRSRLYFDEVQAEPIFPVLRSWYDTEALGTISFRNMEDGPIEQVRVFFQVPEYMGGARLCASVPRMEKGEEFEAPLFAVFDERVLGLTENSKSNATVEVEYSFYRSQRSAKETFPLEIYHRNTMTWEDDRRAAAFVSPTDPASLWFARHASAVARDRTRTNLPRNMQQALSIFEALRLYGVNYVIDPNSSYIELSENATAIDFLQYPSETLMYRGGDCDDLSILYSSLLESVGIDTAFITIPGHIFMAFDLGIGKEEALEQFFDPGLLIIRENRVWAPIEITMVRDGFVKAWRVGAKQWLDNDNAGRAAFFPMQENWARYPPSALPNANARFVLPEESELMLAFDESVNRFMVREIGPVIAVFQQRLARGRDPEILNEYGISLANAGMLEEAWEKFTEAAEADFSWAWSNLAGIAFIRKDYELAHSYYEWAKKLLPDDPVASLGMARAAYELDRYNEAEGYYGGLTLSAPRLAERFGYLGSVYGGEGRAWSMADRLSTTIWSKPGLDFGGSSDTAGRPLIVSAEAASPTDLPAESPASSTPVIPMPETVAPPDTGKLEVPVPDSAPDTEPAPAQEPEIDVEVRIAEAVPKADTDSEPEPPPEPEPTAPPEPTAEPEPVAPPEISKKAPEDLEVSSARRLTEAIPKVQEPEPEEPRLASAPPVISHEAPRDIEIASSRAREESVKISAPEPEPIKAPEPAPAPAPEPAAEATPEVASEPELSKPEPEVIPAPETIPETAAPVPTPSLELVPEPETTPEPVIEPEQTPLPEPEIEVIRELEPLPDKPAAPEPEPTPEPAAAPEPEPIPAPEPETEESPAPETIPEPAAVPEPEPEPEPAPLLALRSEPKEPEEMKVPEPEPAPEAKTEPAPLPRVGQKRAPEIKIQPAREPQNVPEPEHEKIMSFLQRENRTGGGAWELRDYYAEMSDRKAMYAKLIIPAWDIKGSTRYRFIARSTGSGFVGFGIHIHGRGDWNLSYYGGGSSLLVWITSDPKINGDPEPRLQLYRSKDEVNMVLVKSLRIPGSVFDLREYVVLFDPENGTLTVEIDGIEYLSTDGLPMPEDFNFAALRALDTADFFDLSIQSQKSDTPTTESSNE